MGSWLETCMVTHLPIMGGEKCAAVILIDQKYPGEGCDPVNFHVPLAVIKGEYDSYGRLENYDLTQASVLLPALSLLGLKVKEDGKLKDYSVSTMEDFLEKAGDGLYSVCGVWSEMAPGDNHPLPIRLVFIKESILALGQPGEEERELLEDTFRFSKVQMHGLWMLSNAISCGRMSYVLRMYLKILCASSKDVACVNIQSILGLNRLLGRLRMSWHIPSGRGSQCDLTSEMALFGITYMRELKAITEYGETGVNPGKSSLDMVVDAFVGADYFIENVLIALHRRNITCISIGDLRKIGRAYQDHCNQKKIGAVVLLSGDNIGDAVRNYPEFFDLVPATIPGQVSLIRLQPGASIAQLKRRFVGYLPLEIVWSLILDLPKIIDQVGVIPQEK